jgi:triosephosphate isomerase
MKKLLIANWKMHYGPIKAGGWIRAFRRERLPKDLEVAVAVPFVSLAAVRASLGRASIPALAAQDVFWTEEGPFTGEVAPSMLKEFGVSFCLVGHSERRRFVGETDDMIAKKVRALQEAGITPVICVGETEVQRRHGETLKAIRAQVTAACASIKELQGRTPIAIAYEPVWAVGTGKPCSAQDAKEAHDAIRALLKKKFGDAGEAVRILYGGSVDLRNVAEYLTTTGIDGALVGDASLDPRTFGLVCRAAIPA